MNRLKFNGGGQPVYLDDLQTLQENDRLATAALAEALGGRGVFLLKQAEAVGLSLDEGTGMTRATVKGGTLVRDGEMLQWADTEIAVKDWGTPIYLCVREGSSDRRVFEDGQERDCMETREVYVSLDSTGAAEAYGIDGLPTLADGLKGLLGYSENNWKSVNANYRNGYGGSVKYKELEECYRVWISISSKNSVEIQGSVALFYSDVPFLQDFSSAVKACARTENGVLAFWVTGMEGEVRAEVSLPVDDVSTARGLPVKIVFDIPK